MKVKIIWLLYKKITLTIYWIDYLEEYETRGQRIRWLFVSKMSANEKPNIGSSPGDQ